MFKTISTGLSITAIVLASSVSVAAEDHEKGAGKNKKCEFAGIKFAAGAVIKYSNGALECTNGGWLTIKPDPKGATPVAFCSFEGKYYSEGATFNGRQCHSNGAWQKPS